VVSTQGKKGTSNLIEYRRKKMELKARRLARSKPKWKSEDVKYMANAKFYEDYVLRYLNNIVEDGEPDDAQAKLSKAMYDTKMKYEEISADVSAELDMGAFVKHAKESVESESVEVKEDVH